MTPKYLLAAFVVFLSAFLLFQIQPMIARVILPAHGGTTAVWTTCMMFFQIVLLAGYAWAHFCQTSLRRMGVFWHLVFLVVAVGCSIVLLPAAAGGQEAVTMNLELGMTFEILLTLIYYVGVPFFLLASTGPTIQSWIAGNHSNDQTYRLYAYSNGGSILGLITYPLVFEPIFGVTQQLKIWAGGYVVFAAAMVVFVFVSQPPKTEAAPGKCSGREGTSEKAKLFLTFKWVGLAAIASVVFLSITNYLCQEVASIPLLWVVPLSLYLFSFVICFDSPRWYVPQLWSSLFAVSAVGAILLVHLGSFAGFGLQVAIFSLLCFSSCMVCHGELASCRPQTKDLTRFYLAVSVGGSLGGIFVSVIAPHLFDSFLEFQISLLLVAAVSIPVSVKAMFSKENSFAKRLFASAISVGILLSILGSVWSLQEEVRIANDDGTVFHGRNEYGLTRVRQDGVTRQFVSGRTVHGTQWLDPEIELSHSGYYQRGSGVQVAFEGMRSISKGQKLNIAVLGLGAGAMATWFNENDTADFYEINPMVVDVAQNHFSFLEKSKGSKQIILGDGRIEMLRRTSRLNEAKYDLIFMDAFASDSIPVHLLTSEAVEIYMTSLADRGVVVFHITNHFIDLLPVILGHAATNQLDYCYIHHQPNSNSAGTKWLILGRDSSFFESEIVLSSRKTPPSQTPVYWTDDHASVVEQLIWSSTVDWEAIKASEAKSQ